jgi:carbonic anhydrase/acetyltransferase-like protein (isoleucine patch superfamily)
MNNKLYFLDDHEDKKPEIGKQVYLAPYSVVLGDVKIGEGSSIWFNSVIRGDVNSIEIGKNTNIQDLSMIHVTNLDSPKAANTIIGDEVTVGHRVIIHGCTIEDRCLIGMGAIVMDKVVVGESSIIGAGSLVTERTIIPPRSLVIGSPAKVVRELTDAEINWLPKSAEHYAKLAKKYLNKT